MKTSFLAWTMFFLVQPLCLSGPIRKAAEPFPFSAVQLLDSPFKQAMDRNAEYLLSLEPDRLLHNARKQAGLAPKAPPYGGWESGNFAGLTLGYYLSALSLQYAATGDKRFRDRLDYIVGELSDCQKAYGDGYVGGLQTKERDTLRALKEGKVEVTPNGFKSGAIVPWYTLHKTLAGLVDAWALGGNPTAKEVALKLADWVDDVTRPLSPELQQRMLEVEHGGMLDTLTQISSLTGEKRYLDVAQRFYHKAFFDPLLAGRDELSGLHINTEVSKVLGAARTYEVTGDENGKKIAEFFWETVVQHRSFVTGAQGDEGRFFPVGKAGEHLGTANGEYCGTSGMLELTAHLNSWKPAVERADYCERLLFNSILAGREPQQGMFTYYIPLKPGSFRTYSTPVDSFWASVGAGMVNQTKYAAVIYGHADNSLFVHQFIPSVLTWKEKNLQLTQRTRYPDQETTELAIERAPGTPLSILVRCPQWAAGPLQFNLNDRPLNVAGTPGAYAPITRTWKAGDRLRVTVPMSVRTEALEGDPRKLAFAYGPVVLAGDFGPAPESSSFPYARDLRANLKAQGAAVPTLKGGDDLAGALERVPGPNLAFKTKATVQGSEVMLRPLHALPYDRYCVYWDVDSNVTAKIDTTAPAQTPTPEPVQPVKKQPEPAKPEPSPASQLEKSKGDRLVDEVRFDPQSEADHRMASSNLQTGVHKDRKWHKAAPGGYMEFQLKVASGVPQVLRCTYWGDDELGDFDILVDGELLSSQKLNHNKPGEFFDVEYWIPSTQLAGKDRITVRFQPEGQGAAGAVFGIAVLKAKTGGD